MCVCVYICICISNLADLSRGQSKGSLFNSYFTKA